ncbi:hypothetical protein [Kibdelosporangium aridum]|uniref:hypothetical protein n=1 Tax=Kibdelosporangium aridum TaxID=2030 RepID=UPI00406BAD68
MAELVAVTESMVPPAACTTIGVVGRLASPPGVMSSLTADAAADETPGTSGDRSGDELQAPTTRAVSKIAPVTIALPVLDISPPFSPTITLPLNTTFLAAKSS